MLKHFFVAALMAATLTGCGALDSVKQVSDAMTPPAGQRGNFDDLVGAFNDVYKDALFATGQDREDAEAATVSTLSLWEQVEASFRDARPAEYASTADWSATIDGIGELVREARELVSRGDFSAAHDKLERVREWLREVRAENNVASLSDLMLTFHDTMEEAVERGADKDDALVRRLRAELEPIAAWEGHRGDAAYQAMAGEIAAIVKLMIVSEGDEYQAQLQQLKPAFIKLYLAFG
jgi:vacuolar-type H+-ATPase subunit I/STV1